MKNLISLRLSLKNISNNKTRFLLAVIIIVVVSFCMLVLMNVSLNLIGFMDETLTSQYKASGDHLGVHKISDESSSINFFSDEEKNFIIDTLIDNKDNVDSVSFNSATGSMLADNNTYLSVHFFHEQFSVDYRDTLVAGEWWSTDDDFTKNEIWLSESLMNTYAIGSYLFLSASDSSIPHKNQYFAIKGFVKSQTLDQANGYFAYIHHTKGMSGSLYVDKQPNSNGKYWNDAITFKNIRDLILNEFPKGSQVYATNYMTIKYLLLTIGLFLVGFFILSFVLFGTSIGTVVNTLKMSIEEDMRSMGMLLALGMKVKSVKNIVKIQGFLICFVSVLISSIAMIFLTKPIRILFDELLVSNISLDEEWSYNYIIAVPIIVCMFLYGMVVLFIRKKLKTFNKLDVISVINEVS